jgi:hypothetical protein
VNGRLAKTRRGDKSCQRSEYKKIDSFHSRFLSIFFETPDHWNDQECRRLELV